MRVPRQALALGPICLALMAARSIPTSPCAVPAPPAAEWVEVGGSAFTLRLPKSYHEIPAQNPDLEVGGWSLGDRKLVYEFGTGTNPLTEGRPEKERTICEARIGGRVVRIVTGRANDGAWVAAGFWDDLGRISVGPSALTIIGSASDEAGRQEILTALWTVQVQK